MQDRLDGQLQLGAAGLLGEVGGADADDRGLAGQFAGHQRATPERAACGGGHVVAEAIAADDFDRDQPVLDRSDLAAEGQGVVGVPRHAEPDRDAP